MITTQARSVERMRRVRFAMGFLRSTIGLSGAGPSALKCKQDGPPRVHSRPIVSHGHLGFSERFRASWLGSNDWPPQRFCIITAPVGGHPPIVMPLATSYALTGCRLYSPDKISPRTSK